MRCSDGEAGDWQRPESSAVVGQGGGDFRAVFWVALIPGFGSVGLLALGLWEPAHLLQARRRTNSVWRDNPRRLEFPYWWVVGVGALFTLARFSDAFLRLRARRGGVPIALVPLVMVTMDIVHSLSAYPLGKLSDRTSHPKLLALGLIVLIGADLVLASGDHWAVVLVGVALWARIWASLKHCRREWLPTRRPPTCGAPPLGSST